MDLETGLICIGVVAVSAAVVVLTSMFGVRETSYEEAVLAQRKRNSAGILPQPKATKKDKRDKEKKEKKKAIATTKKQQKVATDNADNGAADNGAEVLAAASAAAVRDVSATKNGADGDEQTAKIAEHKDHVEFKDVNQIIILNDEEVEHLSQRRMSRDDKPRKPCLVHTVHSDQSQLEPKDQVPRKAQRGNSFDIVHPKDEFELLKHQEEKRRSLASSREDIAGELVASHATSNGASNGHHQAPVVHNGYHADSASDRADSLDGVIKEGVVKDGVKRKNKKNKPAGAASTEISSVAAFSTDITPKRLIQAVRTLPLGNDEIQSIINELLNRQGDEPSSADQWTQKNDPMAVVKKQLQEKDSALQLETANLKAARERLREIRHELDQEKIKYNGLYGSNVQLQQELQTARTVLQQAYDANRKELSTLQAKLQAKAAEERNVAIQRVQGENARLVQRLEQLEKERPAPETITKLQAELEQLHAERQQFERHQAALQKTNDELRVQILSLEESVKALKGSRQKEEISYQQQVGEVSSQLQKAEAERSAISDELDKAHSQCNNLEGENNALKKRAELLVTEKDDAVAQLESKINELNKAKIALEEAQNRESATNGKVNGNAEQYDQLRADLDTNVQLVESLKSELAEQRTANKDLTVKYDEASDALKAAEASANDRQASEEKAVTELAAVRSSLDKLQEQLNGIDADKTRLVDERKQLVDVVARLAPDTSLDSTDALVKAIGELGEKVANVQVSHDGESPQDELVAVRESLNAKNTEVETLRVQIDTYKKDLSEADERLKQLESRVNDEKNVISGQLEQSQGECSRLRAENEALASQKTELETQKKELESTIKELQGLSQTVAEMEEKLKDLQAKLQGEAQEKKVLVSKFEEVSIEATSKASSVQEELDRRTKEIEELEQSRAEIERVRAEAEQLRADVEKDKKLLKEAQAQNVKLKSLVKIGEDSIKAEQVRINELQEQLKLRNGSVSASTPCLASNGSAPIHNSSNSLNVSEAQLSSSLKTNGAVVKKRAPTNKLSRKTSKPAARDASSNK